MAMQATAKVTWRTALLPSDCRVVDWGLLEGVTLLSVPPRVGRSVAFVVVLVEVLVEVTALVVIVTVVGALVFMVSIGPQ